MNDVLLAIRVEAIQAKVPIMAEETLLKIIEVLQKNQLDTVLELGSAVGYSACVLADALDNLRITTLERDEERYLNAKENILKMNLNHRVQSIWVDIYDYEVNEIFDALIIDAAKAQNQAFYERYFPFVRPGGFIFVDNMDFHGYHSADLLHRRNLRNMVSAIETFDDYIQNQAGVTVERLTLGDGLLIIEKESAE